MTNQPATHNAYAEAEDRAKKRGEMVDPKDRDHFGEVYDESGRARMQLTRLLHMRDYTDQLVTGEYYTYRPTHVQVIEILVMLHRLVLRVQSLELKSGGSAATKSAPAAEDLSKQLAELSAMIGELKTQVTDVKTRHKNTRKRVETLEAASAKTDAPAKVKKKKKSKTKK